MSSDPAREPERPTSTQAFPGSSCPLFCHRDGLAGGRLLHAVPGLDVMLAGTAPPVRVATALAQAASALALISRFSRICLRRSFTSGELFSPFQDSGQLRLSSVWFSISFSHSCPISWPRPCFTARVIPVSAQTLSISPASQTDCATSSSCASRRCSWSKRSLCIFLKMIPNILPLSPCRFRLSIEAGCGSLFFGYFSGGPHWLDEIRPQSSGTPALPRMIPRPAGPNTSSLSTPLLQALRRRPPPASDSPRPDAAAVVAEPEVVLQFPARLSGVAAGFQAHLLVFHRRPQPLHEDVVRVASFAVHADLRPAVPSGTPMNSRLVNRLSPPFAGSGSDRR